MSYLHYAQNSHSKTISPKQTWMAPHFFVKSSILGMVISLWRGSFAVSLMCNYEYASTSYLVAEAYCDINVILSKYYDCVLTGLAGY